MLLTLKIYYNKFSIQDFPSFVQRYQQSHFSPSNDDVSLPKRDFVNSQNTTEHKLQIKRYLRELAVKNDYTPSSYSTTSATVNKPHTSYAAETKATQALQSAYHLTNADIARQPYPPTTKLSFSFDSSLEDQLQQAVQDKILRSQEIEQKLKILEERGLYDSERNVLKGNFYSYYNKNKVTLETIIINIAEKNIINPSYSLGLLAIHDLNETILSGLQNHVIVIYTIIDGYKIVGGYLTSKADENNIKLSDTQPFPRDPHGFHSNKPQFYKPVMIKDNDMESLPKETQEIADIYIQNKLEKLFKEKINPELSNPIAVYNGQGISLQDIENVIREQETNAQSQAKKLFQKYENKLKISEEKANDWLTKLQHDNKAAYPYVKQLIDKKYT